MKHKNLFNQFSTDIVAFAQFILGDDKPLHEHQIDLLRNLGPQPFKDRSTAGILPRQVGLTTIINIILAHRLIYRSDYATIIVDPNLHMADDRRKAVSSIIDVVAKHFDDAKNLTPDSNTIKEIALKGNSVIFFSGKSSPRGISVDSVIFDTSLTSLDQLNEFVPCLLSKGTSLHVLSSGFSPTVKRLISRGEIGSFKLYVHRVKSTDVYSDSQLNSFAQSLGQEAFQKEILCLDPTDPNALARFHRGE